MAKSDREKADPVRAGPKGDLVRLPANHHRVVRPGVVTVRTWAPVSPALPLRSVPVRPPVFPVGPRDEGDDDAVIADLIDTLTQQAGDEWHAPESIDDPSFRCGELLAVELSGYDQVIVDRVEADAYDTMLDAAHELADRLRDQADQANDPGW